MIHRFIPSAFSMLSGLAKVSAFCLCLMAMASWSSAIAVGQSDNQPPSGFEALFNGQDLSGWTALETQDPRQFAALSADEKQKLLADGDVAMKKFWRAEDGQLINDGEGPYLTTLRDFSNFELFIDYKTVAGADSGIYLKATPQVQIWDSTKEGGKWEIGADKGSGGLWNNSPGAAGKDPSVLADKPFGEWNRFRIVQVGARTSIWLNGRLVVDHAIMENYWGRELPLIASGPIQLQTHGGQICWKNVFVRELSSDEANKILADQNAEQFSSIFNGRDLEGWDGPVDGYEVVAGALRCRAGHGGTLFTKKVYDNFSVRFEFKLPPSGNNGLAIRYPGDGDAAYGAMCELQVLDNEHENYAKLDPRQYHGSAYGMAAAHRGYLRPTGEWNFQEVTVNGSTIKVELNGTMILDCDLSKVTEYMANSPHPGKELTSGHFGFAGHNDPVEFRKIAIQEIK